MKRRGKRIALGVAAALLVAQLVSAAASFAGQPSPAATRAYDEYLHRAEARMSQDYASNGDFISKAVLAQPNAPADLQAGHALIHCISGCDSSGLAVPDGLIHDWLGVVFIPSASRRALVRSGLRPRSRVLRA